MQNPLIHHTSDTTEQSKELTDHQIRLLMIVDKVRWSEEEGLDEYQYRLVQRALGTKDVVIEFEMKRAVEFREWHRIRKIDYPSSPPHGPLRSPWMETWDVSWTRMEKLQKY